MKKRRRRMGGLDIVTNLAVSFLAVGLTFFFSAVLAALCIMAVRDWLVPLACRFSYDWFIYMERNGVEFWEKWENAVLCISAVPTLFLSAPAAYRLACRSRGRHFRGRTDVFINYAEGFRFYLKEHAIFDGIAAVVLTTVVLADRRFLAFFPVAYAFKTWLNAWAAWPISLVLLAGAMVLGVIRAQESWRARYIRLAQY